MLRGVIMQLALLLILLLAGGSKGMEEFRPLIEELAGDGAAEMMKEAEQLSSVVSAFGRSVGGNEAESIKVGDSGGVFPLAPVAEIADEGITCCLSRYIASGR